MLQAFDLSHTVDPLVGPLFSDVTFSVSPGERVALVGANGAGKSVLIRLIVSGEPPTAGRIIRPDRIGYLAQDFDLAFAGTLQDRIEQDLPELPPHALIRAIRRLGLDASTLDRPFNELSPGERMRGMLAAVLGDAPDLLVLDEPTNHLDADARVWLATFLSRCPEAVLFASHDRSLIDEVADRVLELERGHLTVFTGNYAAMQEEKRRRTEHQRESYVREKKEDRRLRVTMENQLQRAADIIKKPTGRTFSGLSKPYYGAVQARMDKRAAAIRSRLEHARQNTTEKPFEADEIRLDFPTRPLRTGTALTVRQLAHAFGTRELFRDVNLTLEAGSRLAVLGPNGSGKTTLFRILTGELAPDAGQIEWSRDAQVAILTQERDALPFTSPVETAIEGDTAFVRTALARLGIRGEAGKRLVGVMSVGERTKAEIVAMMASRANVLILDEPTNHLDLASTEALESALLEFPGVVIFSSHDATFVERIATEIVQVGGT